MRPAYTRCVETYEANHELGVEWHTIIITIEWQFIILSQT